jgi:glycosyltransferase A (GT-A) superfamily protein (DUF2064 family)
MNAGRRAVLIFANAASMDCSQRRWPRTLRSLLETQDFASFGDDTADLHLFTSPGSGSSVPSSITVHSQVGSSFGERLENAVETLAGLGYCDIVIVGRDCPDLERDDIHEAFSLLRDHHLVLGPDHRGGCYLIALPASERAKLKDITWQRNTDFAELRQRFGAENTAQLPAKLDLDTLTDVGLLACSESRWRQLARTLLQACRPQRIPPETAGIPLPFDGQRIYWQLPPPQAAFSIS